MVWAYSNSSINNSLTKYQNLSDYSIFYLSNPGFGYALDVAIYQ